MGSYSFAVYASLASDRGYARTYNTQIKPEMVDVTGSMRRTPHEMIKDNFPKLMDALMQLGINENLVGT